MLVGLAFLALVAVAILNGIRNPTPGARGLPPNAPLPSFAAPAVPGGPAGDANLAEDDRGPNGRRRRPACEVRGPHIVTICDYFGRPLVLAFAFARCSDCNRQLDAMQRMRRDFPGVGFVAVDVRDSRSVAARLVRAQGWRFPVALDRDGAVSTAYSVVVGPTTVFAYPGGIARSTAIGELSAAALRGRVEALVHSSKARG